LPPYHTHLPPFPTRRSSDLTCVNDGCIPTKTLVASARAAHVVRRAADYGVLVDAPVRVDMKKVKARKDRVVADAIEGLSKWIARSEEHTSELQSQSKLVCRP